MSNQDNIPNDPVIRVPPIVSRKQKVSKMTKIVINPIIIVRFSVLNNR